MENQRPLPCKCGADARVRDKDPYVWVECKKKCGMSSGYIFKWIPDVYHEAERFAIEQWNKKVMEP